MPIYSIQGPDGKIYEIEGPAGATKAQVVAAIQAKMQASAPAPAPVPMPVVEPAKKEGFGAALGKGIEGILSPSRTAIGALTGSAEEAALAGLKRSEESPYADQVSLDKVKQAYQRGLLPAAGEVARQIPLAITEQAPNIAATLGSAKAGSLLGAKLGTVIAPGVGTAVGTIGGGILGAVAPSLLQQFGGNIQRQAQEQLAAKQPVDISRTAAAAAALPQAGLDVAATFIPLGRTVAGSVLGPQVKQLLERGAKEGAEKLARESLPTVLAKGAGISVATEAPTEVVQSMLERAQAGLPLLSEDAFKEYGEAAYQASLIAPIGSAARVGERSTARQQTLPPENRPGETDRQAAERIQAEILAMKEAAKPPVAPSSPILSTNNLFNLMAQPNGYGLVEQYKQRLLALPKQTPEIEEAIEAATFAQQRADIEKAQRRTTKPAPEEIKDAGETITPPSGEGVQLAGEPGAETTAQGLGSAKPSGVVPSVEDAGQPPRGEAEASAAVVAKAPKGPTLIQQSEAFGQAIGAVRPYRGALAGRKNLPAEKAVQAGDFKGVVNALGNSKNVTVAEVARKAADLDTKIVIDSNAAETYDRQSPVMRQLSIDGAKMHLEALEKIRALAPQIDALPDGFVLGYDITGQTIEGIDQGEAAGPVTLQNIAENGNSMFAPLPTGPIKLRTKEDFKALQQAFEQVTQEVGEDPLRLTSTGSAKMVGVAGVYDAETDTIRVPNYAARREEVLAHEIVHAQTVKAIAKPTTAQRPAVQRLEKLHQYVKAKLEEKAKTVPYFRMPYGIESLQEFVAEGMANPRFQFELNQIEYKSRTAWDSFVQTVADLLGIQKNTAFTELLGIYGQLTAPPPPKAIKTAAAKKHPATVMGSPLLAAVSRRLNGLSPGLLSEFSTRFITKQLDKKGRPVVKTRNPMVPGFGTLFREGGTGDFVEIATMLEEEGYLESGAVERDYKEAGERAKDLIKAALNREEVLTLDEQREQDLRSQEENARLQQEDEEKRAAAEEAAVDKALEGAKQTDEEFLAGLRGMGFTEEEIAEELEARKAKPVKKSLVEMRKRYEAGRAAAPAVQTPPEKTELDKEIEAKIEELGRVLSRIMGKFGLKDVALKLVEDMKAEGEYAQSVVRLALDAASPVQALRHESIHALKELGFFSPQQWAVLEKQAKSKWIDQYLKNVNVNKEPLGEGEKSRYDAYMDLYKGDMDAIIEEAIADAFGDFDVNKAPPGLMQAILNRLRNFFDAVKTAFGGEVTAEQVFRKVEKGELKAEAAPATKDAVKSSLRAHNDLFKKSENIFMSPGVEAIRDDWVGGVAGVGNRDGMYDLFRVEGGPEYTGKVQKFLRDNLGDNFKGYRLMSTEELDELKLSAMGGQFVSFSLNPDVAKGFKNLPAYAKRKDLVVVEMDLTPEHVHMIGHPGEQELVVDYGQGYNPEAIKVIEGAAKPSLRAPKTEAFKRWFGNSKVVDENGEPLVMYHYTASSEDFSKFATKENVELGSHFGTKEQILDIDDRGEYNAKPRVLPVYLSIQNPIRLRDDGGFQPARVLRQLDDMGLLTDRQYNALASESSEQKANSKIRDLLIKAGYDGVVYINRREGYGRSASVWGDAQLFGSRWSDQQWLEKHPEGKDSYIAFNPTQIKSATGNIGTFDAKKPDIRYSLRIMRGEEFPDLQGKVTVDRVGKYFDDQVQREFGRALDYTNPQDFDRAVQLATEEVKYQMELENSGLDWYEQDIQKSFKDTAKVIPELKKADNRILFSVMAGIMSPQTTARDNWFIAAKAFEHYVKTGDIPGINPENGNLWMGGTQSPNKKVQLDFLDRMVKDLGQKKALQWLMSPHTVKEINDFRLKYGNIKSGIEGKATDTKPGLYAFGPKVGPFVSNINGIHDVTVDKWFTRTFNRYFGTMIGPDGKIIDAPTEPQRRFIKQLANKVAEDAGIKNYQVQSLLWFYEQRLFTELGAQSPSYGFSDGAKKFVESRRKSGAAGVPVAAPAVGKVKYSLRDSLGLYSELENKVAQGPNKAPAASWKAYINGLTQKGVKPEEIEWSGVRDWLDLQTGPVSKDAVNAYLKQGGVRVEETVLGSPKIPDVKVEDITAEIDPYTPNNEEATLVQSLTFKPTPRSAAEEFRAFTLPNGIEVYDEYENLIGTVKTLDEAKMLVGKQAEASSEERSETMHGTWVLPGGANYREVLLTLPTQFGRVSKTLEPEIRALGIKEDLEDISLRILIDAGASEDLQKRFDKAMSGSAQAEYRSSHWDQHNVLAHIRLNDRTDADGNKVLFVEELQSDWGQEGKKKGFAAARVEPRKPVGEIRYEPENNEFPWGIYIDGVEDNRSKGSRENAEEVLAESMELAIKRADREVNKPGVPVAPFVTKTEGWLNLALKRIMVMAAEGGYDKVAFVNGEQSADRYDLSKQIEDISYRKNSDGTYTLTATDKNGRVAMNERSVSESDIEGIVGKEIAQKIVVGEGRPYPKGSLSEGMKELSGLDLKVGGEGMKTFYNQIVPLAVKKLLPKVGGDQMGMVDLGKDDWIVRDRDDDVIAEGFSSEENARQYAADYSGATVKNEGGPGKQPGFAVTPEMKQKVETTGLPRFSLRSTIPTATRQRIVQTTVSRDEKTFYQRIIEAISPSSFQSFRADALNRYDRLGVYDKKLAEKMGGKALLASSSAEAAALLSDLGAGLTASALGVHDRMGGIPVYRNGITIISNMNGKVKGPTAIFAPLAREPGDYQAYQYWAAVKRGMRLLYTIDPKTGESVEKLITAADGPIAEALRKQYLKDFKIDFNAIQEDWIKYNDGLVDYMLATGVLSKERASLYKQYADYLPFYRQMNGEETVGPKIFQSIAGVKPPKKIKGGEARIDDFLENIVRNTQSAIQAGVKNIASKAAADVAVKIDMAERLDYQSSAPNVFHVYEDGKPVSYLTQDQLFINAIKSLGLPDLPFIGFLSGPANLLRNLVTKDPGFMLANLMRDSMSAWVTSGVKMTPMVDTISNFGSAIAGKSPEFQALMNAGILGGYEFSQNVEQSGREFGKALRKQAKVKQPGMKGVLEMGAKPFTSLWEALEKGSTASDAATRIEIYKKTLAETGNEAEALYRALEVMNFNRKGSSAVVRILTAAVPFLNARMQGLDVLYRASTGNMNAVNAKQIKKNFFVRGAMIAALSTAYWALTHDDEEYKKQEQETRDNYWLLPSLGVKIPIPFEIGVLFKVIPERILGYWFGSDTGEDFLKSMARQLTGTLAFNPIPQAVLPVAEYVSNYSAFTMRPIVGQGLEGLEPAYQVAPGTTRIAEAIGSATKGLPKELQISPAKMDQLISGYTGTMGMYMVNLMDAIFDMNTDSPKPSRRFEQLPLIRRFALDPEARGAVTGYYELKNSVDSIVRTSNMLERTMNYEELPGYLQDNARMLATKDYLLDLEKTMKEFREMKIMIRSAKMSADAKGDAIASIEKMENQLTANIQYLKRLAKGG